MSTILKALPITPIASNRLYSSFQDVHFSITKNSLASAFCWPFTRNPNLSNVLLNPKYNLLQLHFEMTKLSKTHFFPKLSMHTPLFLQWFFYVRNFFFENNLACFHFFHMPIFFFGLFHVHMHENKKFGAKIIFHSKLIRLYKYTKHLYQHDFDLSFRNMYNYVI